MAKSQKVQVPPSALIQRLNRALKEDDLVLKKTRSAGRARIDLGEYYLVNFRINGIAGKFVDIEGLGREYKVLADYEEMSE